MRPPVRGRLLAFEHPNCIMVFGEPVGIIHGDAIAATVRNAPRWTEVEMTNCAIANQDGNTIAIAYEAHGRRGNSAYITPTAVQPIFAGTAPGAYPAPTDGN